MDDRNLLKVQDQSRSKRWRKTEQLRRRGRCLLAPRARFGLALRIRFAIYLAIYLAILRKTFLLINCLAHGAYLEACVISTDIYICRKVRGVWKQNLELSSSPQYAVVIK